MKHLLHQVFSSMKIFSMFLFILMAVSCAGIRSQQHMFEESVWKGNAISYSGYREGQSPSSGIHPTEEQILEDLKIIEPNWNLIRVYGSDEYSRRILKVIDENDLKIRVMLGIWLGRHPDTEVTNLEQIEEAIRQTKQYPDLVVAINVGNEILVNWSFHPVPVEKVIEYVQYVQDRVHVPVTVADNYAYWRDHGQELAEVVDFVTIHTYPIWERRDIDEGLSYTIENINDVKNALPGKPIVIGEAGWATFTVGDLHVKQAGDEIKQNRYFQELTKYCKKENIPLFWFEAFDEPWKGKGTEGHWGLFTEQRKAKLAMHNWYPELKTDELTSPEYGAKGEASDGVPIQIILSNDMISLFPESFSVPFSPWDGIVNLSAVDRPGINDPYLNFGHTGDDWGGFYFSLGNPVDISDFSILELSIKVDKKISEFELKLEGPRERSASINLAELLSESSDWQNLSIPLSNFAGIDRKRFEIIGFWNPKDSSGSIIECNIQIDGLRFK